MRMKKISIGSWAYTFGPYESHPVSLEDTVKGVSDLGFDGISLGGFKPHAHFDLYPTPEAREQLVELLRSHALQPVEYSPDVNSFSPITQQEEYLKLLGKFLDFMSLCGFRIIRLDSGVAPILPGGLSYAAAFEKMAETFRLASVMARDKGIRVVWEFEPGFLFNKPSEIVRMVDQVNDDNFSVLFDTCHAYMSAVVGARHMGEPEILKGGVLELIDMLAGKIGLVHLIDSDGTLHDGDTSVHRPFGEGFIDFDTLIPALLTNGRYTSDWWVIDLCFWPDAWNVTQRSKEFVDRLNHKFCK